MISDLDFAPMLAFMLPLDEVPEVEDLAVLACDECAASASIMRHCDLTSNCFFATLTPSIEVTTERMVFRDSLLAVRQHRAVVRVFYHVDGELRDLKRCETACGGL